MPKTSKGQKNGLTFYILTELIPELTRQGKTYPNGIKDLVPIALPRYQNLSREEKARFENMAKQDKAKRREEEATADPKRRDNLGNVLVERVDLKEKMKSKRQQDRNELLTLFNNMTDAELLEEKFYLVGFQYMICTEEQEYYPLEYGVVEWSLGKGITNVLHGFVNPGAIPLGYRFTAQAHSTDTHRIPLEDFSEGDSNYQGIWVKLERFLKSGAGNNYSAPAPMYCLESEYAMVTGCLSWLSYHGSMANHFRIKVLEELTNMFFSRKDFKISETSIFDMLTTSAYDFEANTKCNRHDDVEAKHCAVGCPKRYTYALSDALSDRYGFLLTPNHLPPAVPNTSSAILTADNCRLIPQPPSGRGRGKTTVEEPVTFGSRDIRYFPAGFSESASSRSFNQVSREPVVDQAAGDPFPPLRGSSSPQGWTNSSQRPQKFSGPAFKASQPNPSPASMQSNVRTQSYKGTSDDDEDFAERFQNLDIKASSDSSRKFQPSSGEQAPRSNLTLTDIAASFRSKQKTSTVGDRDTSSFLDQDLDALDTFSTTTGYTAGTRDTYVSQQESSSQLSSAMQVPSGRGRGFIDYLQSQQTPRRVGATGASGLSLNTMMFSPVGRGRAYIPPADSGTPGQRPPPGFGGY